MTTKYKKTFYGYKLTKRNDKDNRRLIHLHRQNWIDKFGKLPDDLVVHHINGDKLDNRIDNLAVMTKAAHTYLHHCMEALRECGNQFYRKCHICHKYDDTDNMLTHHSGSFLHRECKNEYQQYRRKKIKEWGGL